MIVAWEHTNYMLFNTVNKHLNAVILVYGRHNQLFTATVSRVGVESHGGLYMSLSPQANVSGVSVSFSGFAESWDTSAAACNYMCC